MLEADDGEGSDPPLLHNLCSEFKNKPGSLKITLFWQLWREKISLLPCLSFMMHHRVCPQNNHHCGVHDGPEAVPSG